MEWSLEKYAHEIPRFPLSLILPLIAFAAGSHNVNSVTVHSNMPFRANRAQACSILTGNPVVEGGKPSKDEPVEMYCSERVDYDPMSRKDFDPHANINIYYPYIRIVTVSLDAPAWKQFQSDKKWLVRLYCQDQQRGLQGRLQ
jgi:hypothetical protein